MKAKIAVGKISVSKQAYLGRPDTFCREFCRGRSGRAISPFCSIDYWLFRVSTFRHACQ